MEPLVRIDDVCFHRQDEKPVPGCGPMGDARVELLRDFYRGNFMNGWVAFCWNPYRKLRHEHVGWAFAPKTVTE